MLSSGHHQMHQVPGIQTFLWVLGSRRRLGDFPREKKEGVLPSASTKVVPLFTLLYAGVPREISFGERKKEFEKTNKKNTKF